MTDKKLIDIKTDSGEIIYVERLDEGSPVFSAGKEHPKDITFTIDEGSVKVVVEGGKIASIKDVPHGITEAEFTSLQKRHARLASLAVYTPENKKLTVWFKSPTMHLMELIASKENLSKLEEGKLIYENLKVAGNQASVESDDVLLASMYLQCVSLIQLEVVEVKKW